MLCVNIIMENTRLTKTSVTIPVTPNAGCKVAVESHAPAGVTCVKVTASDATLTDGIPTWAVTNGWFTINALAKTGVGTIDFEYSDGVKETIFITVYDPAAPPPVPADVTFTVPKTAGKVTLIIER